MAPAPSHPGLGDRRRLGRQLRHAEGDERARQAILASGDRTPADGDALRARLSGQVEEHRIARGGLEPVLVEERPDAPAELAGRRRFVANRERKNLGLDGKGVGARYRNLHGTGDANSATPSKTLSSA
jgi:hypothetical protein